MSAPAERHLGLFGATAVGVGAIVGGGVLALAGVAFAVTGPSAVLAFSLNGAIAFLTAMSFAELAVRFPQSGGTYTYAKRVLSIEVAFVVGWVVWFASIVAGVLYALGFAAFALEGLGRFFSSGSGPPGSLESGAARVSIALITTLLYAAALVRSAAGGGTAATVGKVVVFFILIAGGAVAWSSVPVPELLDKLDPFLHAGTTGLIQAMGYTFIALQGFDLIAAVAGEVKDPDRNLPRAMYLSLAIALIIYIPLLLMIATVGAPAGGNIQQMAAHNPAGLVAEAAEQYLGVPGYWLVIGAGVLSMLSALQANVFGASRVAFAMARDRTLPRALGRMRAKSGTPMVAVLVTAAAVCGVVLLIGDVGAAGAASSLIFLVSFATVHWAAILARRRSGDRRVPWLPGAGALLCIGLAVFQAFAVPEAGSVVAIWLAIGVVFYLTMLAPGARLADATAEAVDPDLARLRGRSPLVLVPIGNPASAAGLVGVAATVRTPGTGRILLHSVVKTPSEVPDEAHPALQDARAILGESLQRSFERGTTPETLFTIADDVWVEIPRVASLHRCETVVLGSPNFDDPDVEVRLETLVSRLAADVVILRAQHRWRVANVRRVLVPIGGRRHHSELRARLLASLSRLERCEVTFLHTISPGSSPEKRRRAEQELRVLARDEASGVHELIVEEAINAGESILRHAINADLVVMGAQQDRRRRFLLGELFLSVARASDVPCVLVGSRPRRTTARRRVGNFFDLQ